MLLPATMLAYRIVPIALSMAAATVVALSALESTARACDPSYDETTRVMDGLGDSQAHHVERVPRNYGYVSTFRDATRVAIAGAPIPLHRARELLPVGPLASSPTVHVEDRVDSVPPGRASLRSGVLQTLDGGCTSTDHSLMLRLGASVVDDLTPPEDITYALFGGTTREQAESEAQVTDFRVATGTSIGILTDAPDFAWFSVAAIDLAGNIGPRSEAIEVTMEDTRSGGCSLAGAPPTSISNLLAFGVIFLLALAGVRRAHHGPGPQLRRVARTLGAWPGSAPQQADSGAGFLCVHSAQHRGGRRQAGRCG